MADVVSPTDFAPKHHLTLTDGTTTVGFVFSNSRGERDDRAFQRFPLVRTALKISQGESKYSDLAIPYATIAQDDWSGGRGSEEFESDRRRFFDSRMADTTKSDGIILAGAPIYGSGYRNQNNNLPGQLAPPGHFYSANMTFYPLHTTTRYRAVSFSASASYTAVQADVWIQKVGTPGTLTFQLRANDAGNPGAVLKTVTAAAADVPDILTELWRFGFGGQALTSGTTYWIVTFGAATDTATNHWKIGSRGGGKNSEDGSSWVSGDGPSFRVTDADKTFRAIFYEYKGQLYFVTQYDDGTTSKVFINGDRADATSNSADLSKVNAFSAQGWTTDEWRGSLVKIIEGTGAMEERTFRNIASNTASALTVADEDGESDNWTIAHHTRTSPVDHRNTKFLILGTEKFTDLAMNWPAGTVIRDLDTAGETVFMAAGEGAPDSTKHYLRRWNMFAQVHEQAGESGVQASFVRVVRDPSLGDILYWARNHEPGKRVTVSSSFFPDTGGGLIRGHREISHARFWMTATAANVVADEDIDGKAAIKVAEAFTTGFLTSTTVSPTFDLRAGNKFIFELRTTIDMGLGDLELLLDDTAGAGSPIFTLPLPALKANKNTTVELEYNTLGISGADALANIGLQLTSDKGAFNIILGEEVAIISDRPSIGVGKKDDYITGLESYGDPETLWVLKEGGLWEVENNVPTQAPIREMAAVKSPDNGRAHAVADVYLYTSLGEGVERYFRQNLEDVGPNLDAGLPAARRGTVAHMVSYPGRLFMAIDAGAEGYSSVVVRTGSGYHELYRAPRINQRIRRLHVQSIPGSAVQRLWISQGSDVLWIPISLSPTYDDRFRYRHESVVETGWIYSSLYDVKKHFSSLKVFTDQVNTSFHSVYIDYKKDFDTSWTAISGNFVSSDNVTEHPLTTGTPPNVTGRRIKFRIRMYTTRGNTPLRIKAIALDMYSQTPLRYGYSWTTKISEKDLSLNLEDEDPLTLGQFTSVRLALDQLDTWAQRITPLTMNAVYAAVNNKTVILDALPIRPMTIIIDEATEEHFVQVSVSELRDAISS